MALYFLTYDLRKSRNYQPLYDELENFGAVRILESTWCFKRMNTSAKGLRGALYSICRYRRWINRFRSDGLGLSQNRWNPK